MRKRIILSQIPDDFDPNIHIPIGPSRFPGKPMKEICGIPMVGHCYLRAIKSTLVSDTYVATCDQEIFDYIKSINGNVVMTSPDHERTTDRCAEASEKIESQLSATSDYVLMLQGDEPFVSREMIDASVQTLLDDPSRMLTNM
ncbi:hypothetical protein N9594_01590 [bacterium]|nr:hypothetical protein [bacterium]